MKRRVKGRELFQKYRGLILILCSFFSLFTLKNRIRFLEHHRYTKGKIGNGVRYALLKTIAKECGENVSIAEGVYLLNPQNLILGSNISIHPMCYLECGRKQGNFIRIDDNVSIAHGSTIIATSHNYSSDQTDIIRDMKLIYAPVHICTNVWIGAKATVLMGTTIQSGCVIGAHSLVNDNTEPDGIYVGSPAHRVKNRK